MPSVFSSDMQIAYIALDGQCCQQCLTWVEVVRFGHLYSRSGVLLQRSDRLATLADDGTGGHRRDQGLEVVVVATADAARTAAIGSGRCGGGSRRWKKNRNSIVSKTLQKSYSQISVQF